MIDEFAHITPAMWLEQEQGLLQSLHSHWDGVPLLNISRLGNLPNKRLVKFRGMVQDVVSPEMYYDECKIFNTITKERITKTMKYCDVLPYEQHEVFNPTDTTNVIKQRQTFIVTTIPGLNGWVRATEQDNAIPVNCIAESQTQKRSVECAEMDVDAEMDAGASRSETSQRKKLCTTKPQNAQLSSCPEQSLILQNPLPKCCHVSLYEDEDKVKVLDLVEFVGFLSIYDTEPQQDSSDEPIIDIQTDCPSPISVVRIHCVAFKKIDHCNLLVFDNKLGRHRFNTIKRSLHFALTQLMMGDTLAAEYLIYHLISKVYGRNETLPLGKFCLNISHIPLSVITEFGKYVYEFIQLLVPTSQYVAMTVENMNGLPFIPRKNFESDRLATGLLQVSNNTHIVLDETKLEPGQLMKTGTEAISALRAAINYQKVAYNYHYYSVDIDCDIAFLILSEGKSLLPSDFHVCLQPCLSIDQDMKTLVKNSLYGIRCYLTQARYETFVFDDDIMKLVQNDFVRLRKSQSISADDLHQLLVLSRLIALSDGKTKLDESSWNKALELEQRRKSRIN